ncbi:MAG: DUF2023 family protein [Spirochaetales bacterium]|nr:DUF2023 family protein [Spirochaetales bacterium]
MRVFAHHLYEYNKGLRRLILHTTKAEYKDIIVAKLERRGIAYILQNVTENKINIYFGADYCIDVLKSFPHLNLRELSPDKDFILGAMLGYDMKVHCRRYLKIIGKTTKDLPESELVAV